MNFHLYVSLTYTNLQMMTVIISFPQSLARTPREFPIPMPVKDKTLINLENAHSYSIGLDDRNKKSSKQSVPTARDRNRGQIFHYENQHR